MSKDYLKLGIRRFFILFGLSLVFVWGLSELAHLIMKEESDRPPKDVTIVIPTGTAEQVALGKEIDSIPDSMIFVVGDRLVVKNEDTVDHQLGPLWIPAGTSASLLMEDANNYDYTCSFRPTRYLGLDIREPTTLNIRLIALGYVTPATTLFFFVYSLILFPLNPKKEEIVTG